MSSPLIETFISALQALHVAVAHREFQHHRRGVPGHVWGAEVLTLRRIGSELSENDDQPASHAFVTAHVGHATEDTWIAEKIGRTLRHPVQLQALVATRRTLANPPVVSGRIPEPRVDTNTAGSQDGRIPLGMADICTVFGSGITPEDRIAAHDAAHRSAGLDPQTAAALRGRPCVRHNRAVVKSRRTIRKNHAEAARRSQTVADEETVPHDR